MAILDPQTVPLPRLPQALEGLRLAHVTDPHLTGSEQHRLRPRFRKLLQRLADEHRRRPLDLLLYTGDTMSRNGQERSALQFLRQLCEAVPMPGQTFGVFGNHDSDDLIDHCWPQADDAPPIRWLQDDAHHLELRGTPIQLLGLHTSMSRWPDAVRLARRLHEPTPDGASPGNPDRPFSILLSHFPRVLPTAADLGVDLVLSGHTHGGQICLPGRRPIKNSSSLPNRLTAGWQQHRDTLLCVSRGLGEMTLPFRVCAPRQLPIYTLTRGTLPLLQEPRRTHHRSELVKPW